MNEWEREYDAMWRWRCNTRCFHGELPLTVREIDVLFVGGWFCCPLRNTLVILHLSCVTVVHNTYVDIDFPFWGLSNSNQHLLDSSLALRKIRTSPFPFSLYLFRFIPTRVPTCFSHLFREWMRQRIRSGDDDAVPRIASPGELLLTVREIDVLFLGGWFCCPLKNT
jgi:hypothetical protein